MILLKATRGAPLARALVCPYGDDAARPPQNRIKRLDAFLTSTAVVTLAEIGDKTQFLAVLLATRFSRPLPVLAGILVATIANHLAAAALGSAAAGLLQGAWFRWIVAGGFLAMALWTLIPDKDDGEAPAPERFGAFMTTVVAFFLVEMGDKTQLATVALGARFHQLLPVAAGTTTGMMIADAPAVLLGHEILRFAPLRLMRFAAAALFALIGLWAGWQAYLAG